MEARQMKLRTELIEAELASLLRVFMAEDTTTEERRALQEKIDPLRAEFQTLNADAIAAAQVEFATNKPNPPEHVAYMARAAELYPSLPPGAQQNALHCLETLGAAHAKRYARNANARHLQNERALMGTTLSVWRSKRADQMKPYHYEGVISDKRRKEYKAAAQRWADYMAEQRPIVARKIANARKTAERRLASDLAAVTKPVTSSNVITVTFGDKPVAKAEHAPRAKINSQLVDALVALLKSEQGTTYAEAAKALKIEPKGDRPHQQPAAQVRALVRDKVRAVHQVIAAEHNSQRGGAVYRLERTSQ